MHGKELEKKVRFVALEKIRERKLRFVVRDKAEERAAQNRGRESHARRLRMPPRDWQRPVAVEQLLLSL